VSLITYGNSLPKALAAAEALAKEGIEAEVVDLRVLRPLDNATIFESVSRTRRCVIVDEGWKSGSISAEIAARLCRGGVLRARRADPARLQPRSADPLCRAHGRSRTAAGSSHRRGRPNLVKPR
jgi:pyruvate/2-oxoglutarate/acetoin dehydrogenase E1 component